MEANMLKLQWVVLAVVFCLKDSFSQIDVCGRAPLNTRIMDGNNASEGAWPWQASIQSSDGHFCGGSLINSQWVLTAAQCFARKEKFVLVHLGLQSLNGMSPNRITRFVKKVIVHPSYNSTNNNNDIALLKLDVSVRFTDYVRPVCLAGQFSTFSEGTMAFITGYNSSVPLAGLLQEAVVPITDSFLCDYLLGFGSITANMICAGYLSGGPDTCQGDFGGPMVTKLGAAWIQAGITSWGRGCTQHNAPSVYTLVSEYQIWISSTVKKNLPGFVKY